jgi:AcrR family transcriptional regulator
MSLPTAPRSRPRDRKQQILAAAARQFWDVGYHRVGMADIAAAVGISAGALYRHFRGKQDLLVDVMREALDRLDIVASRPADLDRTITTLATLALESREFGVLWDRDAVNLPEAERTALRKRLRKILQRTVSAVAASGIPADAARLRAQAVHAVLESPSYHRTEVDRALLERVARAVAVAELPETGSRAPAGGRHPQRLSSRREALLAAAIRLFGERGYPSVSMTDIGTAAGIAGPSVYNHFSSKNELLTGVLNRGNEVLWLGLHQALAAADGPLDALGHAMRSYAVFATENPAIISVLLAEVINLPEEQREAYRRVQREYVAEWVALVLRAHPGIPETEARVRVHAALGVANSLSRTTRAALANEITTLGRATLTR